MSTTSSYLLSVVAAVALTWLPSLPVAASEPNQDSPCALRIATGPAGKVYEKAFADIAEVCGEETAVCQVRSEGGLQNLSLLSTNEADLGFVQIDMIDSLKGGDENVRALQAVMPLHVNLLHIVTLTAGSLVDVKHVMGVAVPRTGHVAVVHNFSDLHGMSVAAVASAQLMARTLEQQLHLGLTIVDTDTDDQALARLRSGEVQAVLTLGGWPTSIISRLRPESGFMLASFDLTPRPPYRAVKRTYQNIGAYNLNFLAAPNLLVSRPFKPAGLYGKRVAALRACLVKHMDDLQEGIHQPLWREIKDMGETYGVPQVPSALMRKTSDR